MTNDKNLFRKQALDHLSSPEQLDLLIHIIKPQDWLHLSVLCTLFSLIIIWMFLGRIPISVSGKGVLIYPRQIVDIQSPISGQIKQLNVKVGDCLKKNNSNEIEQPEEIIAFINPIDLKQQLQQEKTKLEILQQQDIEATNLELQKNQLEKLALQQQRESLQQRLRDNQIISPILKNQTNSAIQQRQVSLQQNLQDTEALVPVFRERLEKRKELFTKGAISKDGVLESDQQYRQNLQNISNIKAQLKQLDVDITATEKQYIDNVNNLSEIQVKLQEITTKEKTLKQQNLTDVINRKNQILQNKQEIDTLTQKIKNNSTIKSPHTGCILELTTTNGQVVNTGTSIGSLEIKAAASEKLVGVTYFSVGDGKKIKPGMEIQITPTSVKREQFGGIVGKVISVSPFPVTKQGAVNVLGNTELVESIVTKSQEPQIEVWAELKPNFTNFSNYEWSSSTGPTNLKLSSGTTTKVNIILEQRQPITFILPFLREWSGIN
ncbi:NHLP bacteriocin system secretion protein [Anabaena cylindrica FACHB-243]|uniref:NHPM bacteriocin system secretion protein n=1 Tax=Anabaena cylindrica (strain ATCC 27899 / PCC 7122) TaxID=272123 RepID=K9ZFC6_ANACC|nr:MULTISPECIES: NHLP bacteriocin system secretion protein [Anabaena]AFZ57449.1 NHPM bacteriocin system secretion protein [Anabaena cylindrica PCC 7122]MBD2421130.1 NHLP bacteriocin system secretion protein [Anabaena cylindrica FACHB-243]MBY5284082.1 NHLP bacteriocin system secretion protein [Anabaena sp. CCAP 1446/1C]MBY5310652.1 NHLP bacteriocin system secretion protein [Anabaena sp. CCAP 1446/1C]MCM2405885.1 NHLP bacteriocin system secretion protein [Anabaena sp. CCAP 1446/1C]